MVRIPYSVQHPRLPEPQCSCCVENNQASGGYYCNDKERDICIPVSCNDPNDPLDTTGKDECDRITDGSGEPLGIYADIPCNQGSYDHERCCPVSEQRAWSGQGGQSRNGCCFHPGTPNCHCDDLPNWLCQEMGGLPLLTRCRSSWGCFCPKIDTFSRDGGGGPGMPSSPLPDEGQTETSSWVKAKYNRIDRENRSKKKPDKNEPYSWRTDK